MYCHNYFLLSSGGKSMTMDKLVQNDYETGI